MFKQTFVSFSGKSSKNYSKRTMKLMFGLFGLI